MSRARVRASNRILKWIRACKAVGEHKVGHNAFYKCVVEERLADSSTRTRDPSRIEGDRIDRAVCKAMGKKVSRTGVCKG